MLCVQPGTGSCRVQPPMLGPLRGRGREHGRGRGRDHGRGHDHDHGEKRHQSGLLRSWPFSRVVPRFLLLCVCSPLAPKPFCRLSRAIPRA